MHNNLTFEPKIEDDGYIHALKAYDFSECEKGMFLRSPWKAHIPSDFIVRSDRTDAKLTKVEVANRQVLEGIHAYLTDGDTYKRSVSNYPIVVPIRIKPVNVITTGTFGSSPCIVATEVELTKDVFTANTYRYYQDKVRLCKKGNYMYIKEIKEENNV